MFNLYNDQPTKEYLVPFTLGSKEAFVKPFVAEVEENFIGKKREIEEKIQATIQLAEQEYNLKVDEYIEQVKARENDLKRDICSHISMEYSSIVDDFFLLAKYLLVEGTYMDDLLKKMHDDMCGFYESMKEQIEKAATGIDFYRMGQAKLDRVAFLTVVFLNFLPQEDYNFFSKISLSQSYKDKMILDYHFSIPVEAIATKEDYMKDLILGKQSSKYNVLFDSVQCEAFKNGALIVKAVFVIEKKEG